MTQQHRIAMNAQKNANHVYLKQFAYLVLKTVKFLLIKHNKKKFASVNRDISFNNKPETMSISV